jgi:hypothetical protein
VLYRLSTVYENRFAAAQDVPSKKPEKNPPHDVSYAEVSLQFCLPTDTELCEWSARPSHFCLFTVLLTFSFIHFFFLWSEFSERFSGHCSLQRCGRPRHRQNRIGLLLYFCIHLLFATVFFFFLKLENNRHRHQKGKKKHAAALRGNENQKRRRGRRGTSFFQLLEISPRQCGRFVCVHRMRVLTTSDQDPQRQTEVNSRTDPHSCSFFSVFFPHFF